MADRKKILSNKLVRSDITISIPLPIRKGRGRWKVWCYMHDSSTYFYHQSQKPIYPTRIGVFTGLQIICLYIILIFYIYPDRKINCHHKG